MKKRKTKTVSVDDFNRRIKDILREEIKSYLEEFNIHHNKSGQFSNKKNSTCNSSFFVDGDRDRVKGSLTSKRDAGRGRNKNRGKGRYRCHDNEPLWELDFSVLLDEAIESSGNTDVNADELKASCKKIGLRTVGEFLDLMDAFERAQKGKFRQPAKRK